jgi:hypothetical protein
MIYMINIIAIATRHINAFSEDLVGAGFHHPFPRKLLGILKIKFSKNHGLIG